MVVGSVLDVQRGRRYENFFGIPVPIIPWKQINQGLYLYVHHCKPVNFQIPIINCAEMQRQQDHIITAVELPGKGRRGIIVSDERLKLSKIILYCIHRRKSPLWTSRWRGDMSRRCRESMRTSERRGRRLGMRCRTWSSHGPEMMTRPCAELQTPCHGEVMSMSSSHYQFTIYYLSSPNIFQNFPL